MSHDFAFHRPAVRSPRDLTRTTLRAPQNPAPSRRRAHRCRAVESSERWFVVRVRPPGVGEFRCRHHGHTPRFPGSDQLT